MEERGDLFDFDGYIVHQCNCTTHTAAGLARAIFDRFPEADVYWDGTYRRMGQIVIRGNVVNLFGQLFPGKARTTQTGPDSTYSRESAFREGLDRLAKELPQDARVAFPHGIGCGLAGGSWPNYERMIQKWTAAHPEFQVKIIRL